MISIRRLQVKYWRDIAKKYPELVGKPFDEVKEFLVGNKIVLTSESSQERQVAMFLSYARGNTTDEDVRWD